MSEPHTLLYMISHRSADHSFFLLQNQRKARHTHTSAHTHTARRMAQPKKELSAARHEQLAEAREAAVMFRRRRQLARLEAHVREVRQRLLDAGVVLSANLPPVEEMVGGTDDACSKAGALLRQCAERRAQKAR